MPVGGRGGEGRGKVEEVCIMGLMSEESVMVMLMYGTVLRVSILAHSFLLIDSGRNPGAGFAARWNRGRAPGWMGWVPCIVSDSACRRRCCRCYSIQVTKRVPTWERLVQAIITSTNPSLGVVGVSRNSLSNRHLTIGEQSCTSSKHGRKNIYMNCTVR
jgi:hypothetical protein